MTASDGRPVAVGVDIGTGSARAVAVDREGQVVAGARAAYPPKWDNGPEGEVDPAIWLAALCQAIRDLRCDRPSALGVGGHGPTTVAAGGELALTYRHPAGASADFAGQHEAQAALLGERFGSATRPRLMWDFMLGCLGGADHFQAVWPGTDGLDSFGEPIPVGSPAGVTDGSHGLPPGIVLAPGANDAYLTAWGCGIDMPGLGFDPGGRTGGLGVAVPASDHGWVADYGIPSHAPGVVIVGGPVASHGSMLDWCSGLSGRGIPELLERAGRVPPGSGGVMVLPFLDGERAPRWVPGLRAEIMGLGRGAGVGEVTRAILESTAYGLAHIALDLAARGVHLHRVVSSGSPSRSPLWTSIKSDVLGVPFDVPTCHEMAAYGAALTAGAAIGWWPRPGDGRPGEWPTPPVTTFEPVNHPEYEEGLRRFISLGDQAVARLGRSPEKQEVGGG